MKSKMYKLLCWRKKAKNKAPLPPGEVRYAESLQSLDPADSTSYNMEQKENLDRDIELTVVLPGERTTSAIVNGSKPMMDVLIFLCAQYHLNPSTYTIDLISADKGLIKFKPNTPIGMLEVEKVVLKSKIPDDKHKKSGPIIPEQTVRVVINYKKTQKTVMRVSPLVPLQELVPVICSKCEFNPRYTMLLKDYQSQNPLDLTKSLDELGLRELYAMDKSKATSPTELKPPLQETYLNIDPKQNDKKFFNMFRRSKKKRDQTSSAPSTPLLNKQRPMNVTRANTVSKSYDSSTLPLDVPKKRRAPLPPMHTSQSVSNNISHGQMRTLSCVVKSVSIDDSEKDLGTIERARTGSLQLTGSSSFNSSLRRTKRKAPLPPSPPPQTMHDEHDNAPASEEFVHVETILEKEIDDSTFSIVSEHNLGEIEEKEEDSGVQTATTSPTSNDITDITESHASSLASDVDDGSETPENETLAANTESCHSKTEDPISEIATLEYVNKVVTESVASTQTSQLDEDQLHHDVEAKEAQVPHWNLVRPHDHSPTRSQSTEDQGKSQVVQVDVRDHRSQLSTEKGTTQDFAVQTNFDNNVKHLVQTPESTLASWNRSRSSTSEVNGQTSHRVPFTEKVEVFGKKQVHQEYSDRNSKQFISTEPVQTQAIVVKESLIENLLNSPTKQYLHHSEHRPKPSNEITRDYLPKIGMTTYKIVPQRSFEMERYLVSESAQADQNSESLLLTNKESRTNTAAKNPSPLGSPVERKEHSFSMRNGNYASQQAPPVAPVSTTGNSNTETRQKHLLALTRSLSSAPVLNTAKSGPETKPKPDVTPSVKAPSSFYLQMQRRASSMYVTSAAAKSAKYSTSTTENTVTSKDAVKDNSQPSHKMLVSQPPYKLEEKVPEENVRHVARPSLAKLRGLETIYDHPDVEKSITTSHIVYEDNTKNSEVKNEYSLKRGIKEDTTVSFERSKLSLDFSEPVEVQRSESVQTKSVTFSPGSYEANPPNILSHGPRAEESAISSSSRMLRSLSSPTSPSAPLSLQKLQTFATPRPFHSSNSSSSFSAAVTTAVRRSPSFSSNTSPVPQPSETEINSGWSPVRSSSTEIKDESLSSSEMCQEKSEEEILTPQLKYRVHSPPPILEKKPTVSFQTSDPETIHESLMAAIRSGEAAANLRKITIRSNTVSVNGRSQISHPAYSERHHEV
uniref:Cordon-bleu WH2 repeat protein like 1 n=1 Tax=Leptobrachium leishanense TaxID=445787 RepID=A0A8C5R9J0_9ANUR